MRSGVKPIAVVFAAALATAGLATAALADPPPQPPEAAPAPAAHDGDTLIADLQQFCIAGHGDTAATLAKADAAGWTTPDPALAKSMDSPQLQHPQVRQHEDAGGHFTLALGDSQISIDGVALTLHMCMVLKKGGDNADLVAATTRWMGPSFGDSDQARLWVYAANGKPGVDPATMSNAQAVAAARAGGLEMIQVQKQSANATVAYSVLNDRP
jgi:hypothetical protein